MTKAFCIAFVMTFFSMFDVPVFWPILLCYWIVLFVLTMRRQISHMIKYKYVPFNIGKQVHLSNLSIFVGRTAPRIYMLKAFSPCIIDIALKITTWYMHRGTVGRSLQQVPVAPVQTDAADQL